MSTPVSLRSVSRTSGPGGGRHQLRRRFRGQLALTLLMASVPSWITIGCGSDADRRSALESHETRARRGTSHTTVEVIVRANILIVDRSGAPVPGARVVAAPGTSLLISEERIESLRAAIEFRRAQGELAWKCGFGITDSSGTAQVQFTRLIDGEWLSQSSRAGAAECGEFPFSSAVRVDKDSRSRIVEDLGPPQSVRHFALETPSGFCRVTEARFVVNLEGEGSSPPDSSNVPEHCRDAAIPAAESELRVREARRER